MEFTEVKVIDKIEVLERGEVLVREATRVYKGDELISTNYHRWSILPGQDYSLQLEKVKAVCSVTHTPQVVADYAAMIEQSKGV
jgi:hypothetical protein